MIPFKIVNCGDSSGGSFVVRVVPHERADAIRALQEVFYCKNEEDLAAAIKRTYKGATIDELLQRCAARVSAETITVTTMDELTKVLETVNTMCLSENEKTETRSRRMKEINEITAWIDHTNQVAAGTSTKYYNKKDKKQLLDKLPDRLKYLKAKQTAFEQWEESIESLPLGNTTKTVEVSGDFNESLPPNTELYDIPVSLFSICLFCFNFT